MARDWQRPPQPPARPCQRINQRLLAQAERPRHLPCCPGRADPCPLPGRGGCSGMARGPLQHSHQHPQNYRQCLQSVFTTGDTETVPGQCHTLAQDPWLFAGATPWTGRHCGPASASSRRLLRWLLLSRRDGCQHGCATLGSASTTPGTAAAPGLGWGNPAASPCVMERWHRGLQGPQGSTSIPEHNTRGAPSSLTRPLPPPFIPLDAPSFHLRCGTRRAALRAAPLTHRCPAL